ncbi:DUF3311 domain-containing protein [Undibacterium terreum]|uniref:DUF3311 domain-containing protein n=1 Tax=Undibacterium terreum TaxID=1224302 RepID=UPI0016660102|nr:DUF3311 domain-containing protein [Undibacterium terreum]
MRLFLASSLIGLLCLTFYNSPEFSTLFGFPIFFWYQFAWVPPTALLIWIVYRNDLKKK